MQENSGGPPSRDNQARGYNRNLRISNNYRHRAYTLELVDQTRQHHPQQVSHMPIPEGTNTLGSARSEYQIVDADGSQSLLHGVNDILNPIQSSSEQHPVQASPSLHAHSSIVPSQGSEAPLHQGNCRRQPAPEWEEWQQQETASGLGVDVRSRGFSSCSDLNRGNSGSQLMNLPSESINQCQNFNSEVHENCAERMLPEPANGTSQAEHSTKWRKCYRSFPKARYDDNTARHYADQLLCFLDIGVAVKCLHCGERGEMFAPFHHHASCDQQALRQECNGQLGPNDTGNNERTVDQRPSAVAAPLASGLSSSSQTAYNQAPSTQCLGAVGGVPNSSMYERGSNDGTCTQGNNLRTWNNGQDMTRQGPFLPPRASEMMAPSVSGLSLNPPPRSNHVPTTPSLWAVGGPQRTGSNQRPYASANVNETRVKGAVNPGSAEMSFTHSAAGPDTSTSSLPYQTAENAEIMARSHGRQVEMQRNQAAEYISILHECHTSIIINMGYRLPVLQQAIEEYLKQGGRSTNFDIQHLMEILLEPKEKQPAIFRPTAHSTGSYQSVPSSYERSGQSSHGSERMDASTCGVCKRREVKVIQYECGHAVCEECLPPNKGERCKIKFCNKEVVDWASTDPFVYRRKH